MSHPRPMASRITEVVADLRFQRTKKTWKGPLPKPRSPQNRQIGDIMVKDLRQSKSPRTTKSLRDLCSEEGGCVNSSLGERKGGGTGSVERTGRSLGRPNVRELGEPAPSKLINVGSHPAFRPTKGLCLLFNAGGCRGVWR